MYLRQTVTKQNISCWGNENLLPKYIVDVAHIFKVLEGKLRYLTWDITMD